MPFRSIADPTKAAMLTAALHEICRQAGLKPGVLSAMRQPALSCACIGKAITPLKD